jgi:hypothetical protein
MKTLMLAFLLVCAINGFAQGTIVYRPGPAVISGNDIDLNQDGIVDFGFTHSGAVLGEELIRLYSLAPRTTFDLFPDFAGEVMKATSPPRSIPWIEGQPILGEPGPEAEWSTTPLNMSHQLVAIRVRNGEDWHYGWMRFEVIGQDVLGDLWGLRDAAYNAIPNAPINMLQVPEPSTWVLISGGALALFGLNRRLRRSH